MSFNKVPSKNKDIKNNPNQATSGNQKGKRRISNSMQKFKMGERKIKNNARFKNTRC